MVYKRVWRPNYRYGPSSKYITPGFIPQVCEDGVVLVHDKQQMISFTVFVRDRAALVLDKDRMVSFPRFVKFVLL